MLPGKPVGNMYFAAWSHNVIANAVNLSNDLKMGEYRKSQMPLTTLKISYKKLTKDLLYSQGTCTDYVLNANLGYYPRRFHQLRRDDFDRQEQQRALG